MSLSFEHVSGGYRGVMAFHDATFEAAAGEIVGLIGRNGAGKTTLLRMAAGLIRPAGGRVTRSGPVIYFGGESTLPGECRAGRWAAAIGVSMADRRRFRRLSRGTRQMIGLRAWLATSDWSVALLDEPWEGLDPDGARWLQDSLLAHRARGAAVVVSSHRLHDVADVCDAFVFMTGGGLHVVRRAEMAGGVDGATLLRMFDQFTRRA